MLAATVKQVQAQSVDIKKEISAARQNAAAMKVALVAGNVVAAQTEQVKMKTHLSALTLAIRASASLVNGIGQDPASSDQTNNVQDLAKTLSSIENSPFIIAEIQAGQSDYTKEIQDLTISD